MKSRIDFPKPGFMNYETNTVKWSTLEDPITFSEEDLDSVIEYHEDPLVIETDIDDEILLQKILIDNESLYY